MGGFGLLMLKDSSSFRDHGDPASASGYNARGGLSAADCRLDWVFLEYLYVIAYTDIESYRKCFEKI